MDSRYTRSGSRIRGRIDTRIHDEERLREEAEDYDSLTSNEKLELTRDIEAEYEYTVRNVTTDALHRYFVANLDPGNNSPEANIGVSHFGLGTDGSSGTATSDTELNQREFSKPVTDVANNGKDLLASTFIDSTEANGETFDELALYSGDPVNLADADVFLMNHAEFPSITKDNTATVTFDVTLTFGDA